jgi:hypothetical protein
MSIYLQKDNTDIFKNPSKYNINSNLYDLITGYNEFVKTYQNSANNEKFIKFKNIFENYVKSLNVKKFPDELDMFNKFFSGKIF